MSLTTPWAPKPYVYQELTPGETRLLTVHPGEYSEPIQCRIRRVALNEANRSFDALSYAWGESIKIRSFKLATDDGEVQITASLNSALRHLRHVNRPHPDRPRTKHRRNLRVNPQFCEGVCFCAFTVSGEQSVNCTVEFRETPAKWKKVERRHFRSLLRQSQPFLLATRHELKSEHSDLVVACTTLESSELRPSRTLPPHAPSDPNALPDAPSRSWVDF